MPLEPWAAATLSVLVGLSADQAKQGAGFNTSGWAVDLGLDQTLSNGQVLAEHSIRIHPSHQHTAA